mgnify:CR=1 FL=1|jgi:hypothetical protein
MKSIDGPAEDLLLELIENKANVAVYLSNKLEAYSGQEAVEFQTTIKHLIDTGYLQIPLWADDAPYIASLTYEGLHYRPGTRNLTTSVAELPAGFDSKYINAQYGQMQNSIETNPSDAIGKAKELLESCAKTLLVQKGISYNEKDDDLPKLMKILTNAMQVAPTNTADESIKKMIACFPNFTQGLCELRNKHGSGHGKTNAFVALSSTHARFVVDSTMSVVNFLWTICQEQGEYK